MLDRLGLLHQLSELLLGPNLLKSLWPQCSMFVVQLSLQQYSQTFDSLNEGKGRKRFVMDDRICAGTELHTVMCLLL